MGEREKHKDMNMNEERTFVYLLTVLEAGLDTMTILTIRYKTVIVNHEELRHRNKGGNTNQGGLSHRDFELL